jgi:hypothetical protein
VRFSPANFDHPSFLPPDYLPKTFEYLQVDAFRKLVSVFTFFNRESFPATGRKM